jgi:hypothetical protein
LNVLRFQVGDDFEKPENAHLIRCRVGSVEVEFFIDSGADVNALSEEAWLEIAGNHTNGSEPLANLKWGNGAKVITAYASMTPLRVEASFDTQVQVVGASNSTQAHFFVIRGASRSLLGRTTALRLVVLKLGLEVNQLGQQHEPERVPFPSVPGVVIRFQIDPSVTPTRNAYYSVPAAYREREQQHA